METKIARPVGSNQRAPRATINKPVATRRPQTWERPNLIRRSPTNKPAPRAAPIAARSTATPTTTGSRLPVPEPSRRPTSSVPIYSRPGPAPRPGPNFSRLQGVSGYGNGAAPFAPRANMAGRAVREVGFDRWTTRHESVDAQPLRARRGRPARIPSAIQEEDEDAESDVLPVVPPPKLNELKTRLQGESARRAPAKVVHARAAPARSQAASLVAATEGVKPARHSWPKTRPRPTVPLLSSLRHSIGHAPENPPRTYMDMHASYKRPSTRRWAQAAGAAIDLGENMSPWSAGTTMLDIRRRAGLGTKFPVPTNALAERRVFVAPFVDAPVLIGRRREERGLERERARLRAEASGRREVVSAPLERRGAVVEMERQERKKGWQKISAFLARKMSLKAKGAAPSPSPSSSPATSSPRTPTTPPSMGYGGSSSSPSPVRAPATPPQVHFAAPVVISGPPYSSPRKATAEKWKPISPPKPALKRASPPCFTPQEEQLARAIASASAPRPRQPAIAEGGEEEEEEEEEEPSPLPSISDADLFPSALVASQRWAQHSQESLHEAVADAVAEETAAADWSGALKKAERVQYVGKGKGRMVDVKPRPARYHGRIKKAAEEPAVGSVGDGQLRRDTLVVEGKGRADGANSKRPVVAISWLRK